VRNDRIHRPAALLLLLTAFALGQTPAPPPATTPAPAPPPETDSLGRTTPYGTVLGFLRAADAGDYVRAAAYLDLPRSTTPEHAQEFAEELQKVLDFGLTGGLAELSKAPEGKAQDGLLPNKEVVGSVKTASGKADIALVRINPRNGPAIWLFSQDTLQRIPDVLSDINAPSLARSLPSWMSTIRLFGVPLWRWLVVIIGLGLVWIAASLVTRALAPLLRRFLRRVTGETDDAHSGALLGPVRLILLAVAVAILSSFSLSLLTRQFWVNLSSVLAVLGVMWFAMKVCDIVSNLSARRLIRKQKPDKIAMLNLGRRLTKILIALIAAVILLQRGGVNVTAMLAGLGVGGVALALAAQKTLESVFGGITIIMREAVRVGDACRISGQIGIIEDIGLASTRVRTLDRTIVSVPNAQLSQANLENLSVRDKFWITQTIRLREDTSAEQMRKVLKGVEDILFGHPKIEKQSARIRFIAFGHGTLTLEIFAYVFETTFENFLVVQQEVLLRVMDVIGSSGAVLATPAPVIDVSVPPAESVVPRATAQGVMKAS
jgi:MscS family membrane protein